MSAELKAYYHLCHVLQVMYYKNYYLCIYILYVLKSSCLCVYYIYNKVRQKFQTQQLKWVEASSTISLIYANTLFNNFCSTLLSHYYFLIKRSRVTKNFSVHFRFATY